MTKPSDDLIHESVWRARLRGNEDGPALWRATIARYDRNASMTITEAEPDVALAELVRYARADAT